VFALASACAAATEIRRYETRVDLAADGSARATAMVEVTGAAAGRLRIPTGFAKIDDFKPGPLPAGATMEARGNADAAWVEVSLPEGIAAEVKLGFSFKSDGMLFVPTPEPGQKPLLPAGSQLLRHRFTNTQEAAIGRYALTVLFPEGVIAHNIREQLPRPGRKEFVPRVELDRFDGRQGAMLQYAKLRQGDRTSMELEIVEQRRSIMWLALLLPLAVGYLVAFRDLVKPDPASRNGR
jgi:hypothetical protein